MLTQLYSTQHTTASLYISLCVFFGFVSIHVFYLSQLKLVCTCFQSKDFYCWHSPLPSCDCRQSAGHVRGAASAHG